MALLKMGSLVTQISGKIGGQTFGTGQGGQYVKNTGSYINKLTQSRSVVNSRLSSLSNSWRSLTTSQKNSWSAAAPNFPYVNRLGESRVYSGYNLYMKFNGNRALLGLSPVSTAPVPFVFTDFLEDDFNLDTNSMFISLDDTTADCTYVVFASNPSSSGSNFNVKGLRFIKIGVGGSNPVTIDFTTEYQSIFGVPKIGSRIFVRVFMYETASGIKSGFFLDKNDVIVI